MVNVLYCKSVVGVVQCLSVTVFCDVVLEPESGRTTDCMHGDVGFLEQNLPTILGLVSLE